MKEFSFIKTSLWVDESFRQMSPEQKLIMLYLLQGTQTNWCGIFKLNISMMGFFLGLRDDNVQNAFQSFLKHYHSLVRFDENTSEVAILNWGGMNLVNMNEKSLSAARRDLSMVESETLILGMITESKASKIVEFYTSGLNSMRATRRNLEQKRADIVSQPPQLTNCESGSYRQREIEKEKKVLLEKEPKQCENFPLQEHSGTSAGDEKVTSGKVQQEEPIPPVPPVPPSRRPPTSWDAVLRLRATPALDGTVSPSPTGDAWERRMHVFDAVRKKYPGTKAGLLQEFNGFLKKCWKDKLDIDRELSQMPYAVLYQIKWREAKEQAEEFAAAWKNFPTWINQAHWQSDMDSWKSRAEWFNQMCSPETKARVEELKSILTCK